MKKTKFHQNFSIFHFILIVIDLLSSLLILQINLRFLPLIEANMSQEYADSVNTLISNFAQGILISSFFYYLLSYFPERKKGKSIRALITPRLHVIVDSMAINIKYLMSSYNIDKYINISDSEIKKKLLIVNVLRLEPMNFVYKTDKIHDEKSWYCIERESELDYFIKDREKVLSNVNEILNMQNIINEDIELIEILNNIKESNFYYAINYYNENKPNQPYITTPKGRFNRFVVEYYELLKKLSFYVSPTFVIVKKEESETSYVVSQATPTPPIK